MILWISTGIYLLWLLYYYRKHHSRISSNYIATNSILPTELSILQSGFLLKEEELSYKAETTFLLQEGYLELAKEQKPYHNYHKTKKSRASLDMYEKFFINKILFPKVQYRSTRDGEEAPYAIDLSQDKSKLQEMLNSWAVEEQYINKEKQSHYQKLFGTLFTLFGIIYIFLVSQFESSELLTTAISLIVLCLGIIMGVYFVLNLVERIVPKSLLSTHNTILLAVAIGLMGTNFLLIHKLPTLEIVDNPFIVLSILLFFTIATYLNLDFLTPKGAELKAVILDLKRQKELSPSL